MFLHVFTTAVDNLKGLSLTPDQNSCSIYEYLISLKIEVELDGRTL